jgi:hypothetical protein
MVEVSSDSLVRMMWCVEVINFDLSENIIEKLGQGKEPEQAWVLGS